MRRFSLDCLTLPDVTPVELIQIAAATGYHAVSLWAQPPVLFPPMLAESSAANDIRRALADHNIVFGNLEVFNINTDAPIDSFESVIAFGADLGAKTATAIDFGEPRADIAERLAAFHALCARHGLGALIEPIAMGNVRTPQDGVALIQAAGVDAKLVIDCLHLIRTGGSAQSLASIPAGLIGHFQLCDGPATIGEAEAGMESMANRLYPGEGEFPLVDILKAIPKYVSLGVEAPSLTRQQRGMSARERARELLAATKLLFDVVDGGLQ